MALMGWLVCNPASIEFGYSLGLWKTIPGFIEIQRQLRRYCSEDLYESCAIKIHDSSGLLWTITVDRDGDCPNMYAMEIECPENYLRQYRHIPHEAG